MSKTCNSIAEALAYIEHNILPEILKEDVAPVVKETWQESVDDEVYKSGEPIYYNRRGNQYGSQGLGDTSQMEDTLISDNTLEVVNNAQAQGTLNGITLSGLIESGYGNKQSWYNKERPVVETTKKKLQENKACENALKEGLIKRGFDVSVGVSID